MRQGPNPSGLCMCGCGRPVPRAKQTYAKFGHVKDLPIKYLPGHHMRKSPVDYIVDPETDCWIWQLHVNTPGGYGRTSVGGKHILAHRLHYMNKYGPIPSGMQLDHLCRNRRCVNPDHLEVVTQSVNQRRGARAKLDAESVKKIRQLIACGLKQASIGEIFGVSQALISRINRGASWSDVA